MSRGRRGSYYAYWDYCKTTKYVRNYNHKKKLINKTARECWREQKQFKRDKAKYTNRDGPWKAFKHFNNITHRATIRHLLANERYEDFHNRMWLRGEDPWAWD